MKATDVLGIIFFIIFVVFMLGAGSLLNVIGAWEYGNINGINAFIFGFAILSLTLAVIFCLLAFLGSGKKDNNENE